MWDAAVTSWRDLEGLTVTGWRGVEMALHGGEDGEPAVFEDARIPFRQFWALDLLTVAGARRIGSYQNDNEFGFHVTSGDRRIADDATGIYRNVVPDLPTGRIVGVRIVEEADVVAEATLVVGVTPVLLVAGEVEPTPSGGLDVVRYDESVLVFADPAVADRVTWRPPRPPRLPSR